MKRWTTTAVLIALASLGTITPLQAQVYIPPTGYNMPGRPPLSPYLNLLRGGDTAANYFLGVIPEQQARSNYNNVQRSLANLDTRVATLGQPIASATGQYEDSPLPPTGHRTWYGSPNNSIGQPLPAVQPSLVRKIGSPLQQPTAPKQKQ